MKTWNLMYPRVGKNREWKVTLENFWHGNGDLDLLWKKALEQCSDRWNRQHQLGLDSIPANDFSFYDQVLDHALLFGVWPKRFQEFKSQSLTRYFAMARGVDGVTPLDMKKWFNTNYHYLVPEADPSSPLKLDMLFLKPILEHLRSFPFRTHAVLLGPYTFSRLVKLSGFNYHDFLEKLLPLYRQVLAEFKKHRFEWVHVHEPLICSDLLREDLKVLKSIYDRLEGSGPNILLAAYYESPDPWMSEVVGLHVQGFHWDIVSGTRSLSYLKTRSFPKEKVLSLGMVDGRNVWATSLQNARKEIVALSEIYEKIWLAPSCPLIHLPYDVTLETELPSVVKNALCFADQRLEELLWLKRAHLGDRSYEEVFTNRENALQQMVQLPEVHRAGVRKSVERIEEGMRRRSTPFSKRSQLQSSVLNLPPLPLTSVGSFPQTEKIKGARQKFYSGERERSFYETAIEKEISKAVSLQDRLGFDVLVHGESERADMVEYFASELDGMALTHAGWVQSYGTHCVRPPILYGDIERRDPITVKWFQYAQSLTTKPMKGIVTGPVTLLNWCYVRNDLPREKIAYQLALAIRQEVVDLEKAGAKVIQIDEPALREGLPLKKSHWNQYLKWAIDAFKIASSGVKDATQIQTHMCYSDFTGIIDAIIRLDVDVLLIEQSRSADSMLEMLGKHRYLNAIGPGVYDVHSPWVPPKEVFAHKVKKLITAIGWERLWITPDCGLKTRTYDQVEQALKNLSAAVKELRQQLPSHSGLRASVKSGVR